jgi:hypothetical protein
MHRVFFCDGTLITVIVEVITNTEGVQSTSQVQHVRCGVTIESEVRWQKKLNFGTKQITTEEKSSQSGKMHPEDATSESGSASKTVQLTLGLIHTTVDHHNQSTTLATLHQSVDLLLA